MLVKCVYSVVSNVCDLKKTVAEKAGAIIHRYHHILYKIVFSVIVTEIFHFDDIHPFKAVLLKFMKRV